MGLPTMLQLTDITVSLPQKRQDLDQPGSQRADRLVTFTTLTMVMDEIINAGFVGKTPDLTIYLAISNMDT
jgi:hypothetical protein